MTAQLLLASGSPRRAELLRRAGFSFDVRPVDVPESPEPGQAPGDYALATAMAKARAALSFGPQVPVLAADTDVAVEGQILGKPADAGHALAILARLSGRTHQVFSAIAVVAGDVFDTALSVTDVTFGEIRPDEAQAYWDSGEPADKAGAYAIQGTAGRWVRELRGSYSGVVGLPLYETCQLLRRFGVLPR